MSALSLSEVHKAFGDQAVLRGVNLSAEAGSLTAILGPSGSGKTTLLRIIAGFERVDRGAVSLGGATVDDGRAFVAPEHRGIGYVPQEGSLFPHMTVEANVGFGLSRRRRSGGRVNELLELVGLAGLSKRYPHELSGGQQQRVALARALAIDPGLVLLDEPFSSLDANLRASVRSDVRRVLAEQDATVVLVTHDQDEALSLADRIAVLRDGRVGQFGSPHDLYTRPLDPDLATFLGDANLVPGLAGRGVVDTVLGELALAEDLGRPLGSAATVLVRPEQVVLRAPGKAGGITGRVVEFEYYGHDAVARIAMSAHGRSGEMLSLVARIAGGSVLAPGAPVAVTIAGPVMAWPADSPGARPGGPPDAARGCGGE